MKFYLQLYVGVWYKLPMTSKNNDNAAQPYNTKSVTAVYGPRSIRITLEILFLDYVNRASQTTTKEIQCMRKDLVSNKKYYSAKPLMMVTPEIPKQLHL